MSHNEPMQNLGELWIMASKQSMAMTPERRAEFKASGIRDPERFMKTITKADAGDKQEGFSMANVNFDFWNIFDFVVVVVCYLPLGASMVAVIRLFRLLRVLKLVKALPELQVRPLSLLILLKSCCKGSAKLRPAVWNRFDCPGSMVFSIVETCLAYPTQ